MESLAIVIQRLLAAEARRLARKAKEDEPDKGEWRGEADIYKVNGLERVYHFTPSPADPLRFFHFKSGFEFRAGAMVTDLGSIPWVFQQTPEFIARLKPDTFKEAYCFHDFACSYGFLWVRRSPEGDWKKLIFSKRMADVFLAWGLSAKTRDGTSATRLETFFIYRAARMAHKTAGQ